MKGSVPSPVNVADGANLTGGDTLQGNSNGATLTGTFLDPNGTMSLTHSVLNGRFFGDDTHDMQIVSGAYINVLVQAWAVFGLR